MIKLQLPIRKESWLDVYLKLKLKNLWYFYWWFNLQDWGKISWGFTWVNLRQYEASFASLKEMQNTIKTIEKEWFLFSYVFNQTPRISEDNLINKEIDFINKVLKPRSIIMQDLLLMHFIDKSINIHISSLSGLYNSTSINYFKENIKNINRIIFSRDVSIDQIHKISDNIWKLDLEIFIKHCWCYHSNSHCWSLHKEGLLFLCHREERWKKIYNKMDKNKLERLIKTKIHCKACSIFQLKEKFLYNKDKNIYLKILWRESKLSALVKDAKFIDEVVENCKDSDSYKVFIAKNILLHKKIFWNKCYYNNCEYYLKINK